MIGVLKIYCSIWYVKRHRQLIEKAIENKQDFYYFDTILFGNKHSGSKRNR